MDMKRSDNGLIEVAWLQGLRKATKEPQSGWPVYGPRFEPETSKISTGSNHSTHTLGSRFENVQL
jgi:hypothetical protein